MKHLEIQIKFIDTKLLPIYGFKNIIDYAFILCISDLDNLKIDLDKLNGLVEEFRKVFHSKNFSLHKTQYKILTKSQAICLLKTCLETTSIPFDISLKKNKKYLRLISKNNILDDYINTLKMTENGSFNENKLNSNLGNYIISPDTIDDTILNNSHKFKIEPSNSNSYSNSNLNSYSSNHIVSDWKNSTISPDTIGDTILDNSYVLKAEPSDSNISVYPWIPEGYKKFEEPKKLNKEQLNNGIKKINNIEFFLSPKRLIRSENFNESVIQIDMKKFNLDDKILKSFCVKFISKKINNQPIIAESFIEHLIKNIEFKIIIGGYYPYNWAGKFTNGINCLIDDIILPNKCLECHTVMLYLTNIDDILYLLENLEIKVSCECVSLYTELDNIIKESMIEQLISMGDKCNIFRIICGMAGNAYSEYVDSKKFNKLDGSYLFEDEHIHKNEIELNKNDIINESNLFVGNKLSFGEIEGFEIKNHSKDFINQNASHALNYKYDFVSWDIFYELKTKGIEYYRITNKNTFTHRYKINIFNYDEKIPHTISKLQIISNFNVNKILNTSINFSFGNKKLDIPIKYNFDNGVLEIDLENKHLILCGKITDIIIEFESVEDEELVGEKLSIVMKGFNWVKKFLYFFISNKIISINPNSISLEYKKYLSDCEKINFIQAFD